MDTLVFVLNFINNNKFILFSSIPSILTILTIVKLSGNLGPKIGPLAG
jgi:hypothetical protein